MTFQISDEGYNGAEPSRATENGYATEFAAGDACGMYMVRNGKVAYANVKLTATVDGTSGDMAWQPETPITGTGEGEAYYLYYPYQADMDGQTAVPAGTDQKAKSFFQPLIAGWQPAADQSTVAAYAASDLMTATGIASLNTGTNKIQISFGMTHRMALAVIETPDSYAAPVLTFADESPKALAMANGTYRYIVNPASPQTLSGLCDNGTKKFTFSTSGLANNQYKTYKLDGGKQ